MTLNLKSVFNRDLGTNVIIILLGTLVVTQLIKIVTQNRYNIYEYLTEEKPVISPEEAANPLADDVGDSADVLVVPGTLENNAIRMEDGTEAADRLGSEEAPDAAAAKLMVDGVPVCPPLEVRYITAAEYFEQLYANRREKTRMSDLDGNTDRRIMENQLLRRRNLDFGENYAPKVTQRYQGHDPAGTENNAAPEDINQLVIIDPATERMVHPQAVNISSRDTDFKNDEVIPDAWRFMANEEYQSWPARKLEKFYYRKRRGREVQQVTGHIPRK